MRVIDTTPAVLPDGDKCGEWVSPLSAEIVAELWQRVDGRFHVVLRDTEFDEIIYGVTFPQHAPAQAINHARGLVGLTAVTP